MKGKGEGGRGMDGKGRSRKKLWWARDWWKKYLYNFNCFSTTLSLAGAPRVKGLCITGDESL